MSPIPLIASFEKGPRGSGVIVDHGDSYLIKSDTGQTYLIAKTSVGDYVSKVVLNTKVAWSLNSDMTALWGISPWSGVYIAEYAGMVLGEGQTIPEPKLKEGGPRQNKRGGTYISKDRYVFTIRWKINSPPFDGVDVVKQYTYAFYLDRDQVIIRGGQDAKRLWQLMESHGIDMENESIPVEENVLPWLDKRIRELHKHVQLKFDEGWVNDITPMPIGMEAPQAVQSPVVQGLPAGLTPEMLAALMQQLGYQPPTPPSQPATANQEVAKIEKTQRYEQGVTKLKPDTAVDAEPHQAQVPLPGMTLTFKESDE